MAAANTGISDSSGTRDTEVARRLFLGCIAVQLPATPNAVLRLVRRYPTALALLGLLTFAAVPVAAQAFSPTVEAENFAKGQERQTIYDTPQYQALLAQIGAQNHAAELQDHVKDSGRSFSGNVCASGENGCAGDVRLYDWASSGYGLVEPVLFTARDGATLSGHVWATRAGPAKRPGVVITVGSAGADEQMYWYAAQALAKDGYVVLTFDVQGQGQSDTHGESPDQNEGYPAQTDGRPFFDGTEDAINFFLSTAQHPYEPVPSCSTGTSHAAKQNLRVAEGFDAAYNPFWRLLNPSELGLAGHSRGAAGISYIGQWDPRVRAIVAWDNLYTPNPNQTAPLTPGPEELPCPGDPGDRTIPKITKPGLGLSADYFIPPVPNTSQPNPMAKSTVSLDYTKAGVDTGEIIIRGGTHYDFDWIPNDGFPATLRGADMITWYTTAWFDKYLKHDCTADARLLTQRWRADGPEAAIDPNHDGNMFSFYYRSRLDIHLANGRRYDNENLRADSVGLTWHDRYPGEYSYLNIDRSPDNATIRFGPCRSRHKVDKHKAKKHAPKKRHRHHSA